MKSNFRIFNDFLSLFYPNLCLACGKNIPVDHAAVCVSCQYYLPKTQFHLDRENPFTERFWGRVNIHAGAALYHFSKEGRAQSLIHELKYNNKQQIGVKLGKLYGRALRESPYFNTIDMIVPVPLHTRKLKKRGYNQSALFAQGLSETMEIPWSGKTLTRVVETDTQTKKSRMDRFENVKSAFNLKFPKLIKDKHILLVDDVMTTGATLEACAEKLIVGDNTRVSLATIAFASL